MITNNVVLVLGAGASVPYGFPLGTDLVKLAVDHSRDLKPLLKEIAEPLAFKLDEFLEGLHRYHPTSIDAFMEGQSPILQEVGKAVIAYHLMQLERGENFFDGVNPEEDWYQHLLHEMLLIDGLDGLNFSNIAILTYNYDRSLEYAILDMLTGRNCSEADCHKALNTLHIRHLHGQIGYLPELNPNDYRPYDTKVDVNRLRQAMNGIRAIPNSEEVENDHVFREAYLYLRQAKYVIFLGCGYHEQNITNLNLQVNRNKNTSYWGTGVRVTKAQTQRYARLFPGELPAGATKRITIDTEVKGVKEYMCKHEYLFMD